ncbi:MAG: 16S rRNA (uracil(1498)-N(3))-methyltransferase [Pyrinomonadaceae bacterium]
MRRFYAPPERFLGGLVKLDPEETRHLRQVLRLRVGDPARVFNGVGDEYQCLIQSISKSESTLTIVEQTTATSRESPFHITLAVAMLKGEKFDLVVQKSVELGVATLIPLQTARCEVQFKESGGRADRWRRLALEATKQSGRAKLIEVREPISLPMLLTQTGGRPMVMFSERGGDAFSSIEVRNEITAIVGPEGGWDDDELEQARSAAVSIVTLRGRVLRAETAAMSIAAILQHRFGDLN